MFGIDDIIGEGLKIVDKFIPDTAEKDKAAAELKIAMLNVQAQVDAAQASTNTEEAKSSNIFVAGWRPMVGWVCAAAFAWAFVLQPVLLFIMAVAGWKLAVALPVLDLGMMTPVLLGMLGLGGLRTYEKINGIDQNNH